MSSLTLETRRLLLSVRQSSAPMFSNLVLAAEFELRNRRGDLAVLPKTTGGYLVFDYRRPLGQGVLEDGFASESDARAALDRLAERGRPSP